MRLFYENGESLDNFTIVTPGEEDTAVEINNSSIRAYKLSSTYGSSWTNLGCYFSEAIQGAIGHVAYCQMRMGDGTGGPNDCMVFGIRKTASIDYQVSMGFYFSTSHSGIKVWDSNGAQGTNFATSKGDWRDLKIEIVEDGAAKLSARESDSPGNFNPSSSEWTEVYTSQNITGFDESENYFYFLNTHTAVASSDHASIVDEFYYTDDGDISDPDDGGNFYPRRFNTAAKARAMNKVKGVGIGRGFVRANRSGLWLPERMAA